MPYKIQIVIQEGYVRIAFSHVSQAGLKVTVALILLCLPTKHVSLHLVYRVLLGLWSNKGAHGFINGRQAFYRLNYSLSSNLAFLKEQYRISFLYF